MAKKPVNDPLESAKVGSDTPKKSGWGKSKKKAAAPEATAPVEAATESKPNADGTPAVAPAPLPEPPKAAGPKPTPKGIFKFKVLKTRRISRNGQVTKLKAGTVISSQHYGGMASIEKLKDCGVEMEPVEG